MCTDFTIQKHLLLEAFTKYGGSAVPREVLEAMTQSSIRRYGTPDYATFPDTLDTLIDKHTENGFIQRVTPSTWRITERGSEAVKYIERRYIPEPLSA